MIKTLGKTRRNLLWWSLMLTKMMVESIKIKNMGWWSYTWLLAVHKSWAIGRPFWGFLYSFHFNLTITVAEFHQSFLFKRKLVLYKLWFKHWLQLWIIVMAIKVKSGITVKVNFVHIIQLKNLLESGTGQLKTN